MTKLCSHCGAALERDTARFCQNCGKPTSPHSLPPTVSSTASPGSEEEQTELFEDTLRMPVVKKSRSSRSALPEQIAQQPVPVTPVQAVESERSALPESAKPSSVQPPRTEVSAQGLPVTIEEQPIIEASAPFDAPQATALPATPLPLEELPSTPRPTESQEEETHVIEEEAIEDKPTLLIESYPAETLAPEQVAEETAREQAEGVDERDGQDGQEQIEQEPTRPVIAQPIPAKFSAFPDAIHQLAPPAPQVPPSVQTVQARFPEFSELVHKLTAPLPAIVQPISAKLSALPDTMRGLTSSVPALPNVRQRLPAILIIAVVLMLVLIGVSSWLFIAQPFSVPSVTQPQLGFSDAHLGLSLLYPNGWSTKKDTTNSNVQFYDSSHTAQITITISNVSNSTITASLQKQSALLGMSGAKSVAPLSFAGAYWQGTQGTVRQGGASYTCTIFATVHANHLVILTQLAPQSVYEQEDSVVFSAVRQSLRFV